MQQTYLRSSLKGWWQPLKNQSHNFIVKEQSFIFRMYINEDLHSVWVFCSSLRAFVDADKINCFKSVFKEGMCQIYEL